MRTIKIILEEKEYEELIELIDIFEDCYVENKEVTCIDDIKKIIDDEINIELLDNKEKAKICRQLKESLDWLVSLNISTKTIEIVLSRLE